MDFERFFGENDRIILNDDDTLVHIIETHVAAARASDADNGLVFRYLDYSKVRDGEPHELTWTQFGTRIRAIAGRLQQVTTPGDRVAILAPQGLDYVVSFFASIHAGLVAVPLFDPDEPGHTDRLHAVLGDCKPAAILTSSSSAGGVRQFFRALPAKERPRILAVDAVPDSVGESWKPPKVSLDATAYLQYTSGSTRVPAGVVITHRNVMTNALQMYRGLNLSPDNRGVTWLPLYHDMGLLTVILPALGGRYITIMSPRAFVQRPGRWIKELAASSDGAGTFSAAPNFAFEHAATRGLPKAGEELDLSKVVGLINGSEPVTPASIAKFNEAFIPYGLPQEAIKPSYGMAEATLFVSSIKSDEAARVIYVQRDELAAGTVVEVDPQDPTAVPQVPCGYVAPNQWAVIVEPELDAAGEPTGRGRELPDGSVGEIWLHGENIGRGYWGRPEESVRTFENRLSPRLPEGTHAQSAVGTVPEDGDWLNTGDYGVYYQGELYITGRAKDLVIVDGRNHYPQDVEGSAQEASTALRPGFVAAFAVPANQLPREVQQTLGGVDPGDGSEQLVIVAERAPGAGKADPAPIAEQVRAAVSSRHGVTARDILLVPAGSIPRTSSGKIARRATKAAYMDGTLRGGYRQDAFPDAPISDDE